MEQYETHGRYYRGIAVFGNNHLQIVFIISVCLEAEQLQPDPGCPVGTAPSVRVTVAKVGRHVCGAAQHAPRFSIVTAVEVKSRKMLDCQVLFILNLEFGALDLKKTICSHLFKSQPRKDRIFDAEFDALAKKSSDLY